VSTHRQRSEEKRQAKLDDIQQQIAAGKLVVRKMTPAERAKFQPRSNAKFQRRNARRSQPWS